MWLGYCPVPCVPPPSPRSPMLTWHGAVRPPAGPARSRATPRLDMSAEFPTLRYKLCCRAATALLVRPPPPELGRLVVPRRMLDY